MPGMLLRGGAQAVAGVGTGAPNAGAPPMTASPAAATSATSAGAIAFGGAQVQQRGGFASLLRPSFLVPAGAVVFLIVTYHSLPR